MRYFFLFTSFVLGFFVNTYASPSSVRLRGYHFQGFEGKVTLYDEGVQRECCYRLGVSSIRLNSQGDFDTTIVVNGSRFLTVDNCNIYLVPGADLEITYNDDLKTYSFTGKTANESQFLTNHAINVYVDLSLLEGGKNARSSFVETKKLVDSIAIQRDKLLASIGNLDPFFVEVERAATRAHIVNSYLNYYKYTKSYQECSMGDEVTTQAGREYVESIRRFVEPITKDFIDDRLVVSPDIRWIMERCINDRLVALPKGSVWEQLFASKALMRSFEIEDGGIDSVVVRAKELLPALINPELHQMVALEVKLKDKLASGKLAPEFVLEDIDGSSVDMNQFKGKPLYIDLWATWCGICIAESPDFVKLKEKYPNIKFIAISSDVQKTRWKSYLSSKPKSGVPQFIAANKDNLYNDWNVFGVPRYILIDKDYRIVDAYAPHPNSEKIEEILEKLNQQ